MKQTLQLKVSTHLALTPQLQQSIKLLQMSTIELNEEIEKLLLENPMLERIEEADEAGLRSDTSPTSPANLTAKDSPHDGDDDGFEADSPFENGADGGANSDSTLGWSDLTVRGSRTSRDDDDDDFGFESYTAIEETLPIHLSRQLGLLHLSDRDRQLVQLLIDSLDEDGYLEDSLENILDILPPGARVGIDDLTIALALLQNFDPSGVGARSLAECLRLQIDDKSNDPINAIALTIVEDYLDVLAARDYVKLKKVLRCSDDELKAAVELITSLNPRPGAPFAALSTRYIVPDVIVRKQKGRWRVFLNEETFPKLKINQLYAAMLSGGTISKRDAKALNGQLQEAKWFLRNIQQRFETILRVTHVIVERQADFLEHGEIAMRPLVLKEIAQLLDLHESTISRVTNQKYIQTPRGIYELKYFFTSHCATETGGACSSTAIKALIRQLIAQEDSKKPLSDSKIALLLGEQGIVVARRTVAKYRETLQIPPINQRKTI